jgi:hypothetical protein
MAIPGIVLFIFIADFIHMGQSTIGAPFVFSYLTVSLTQVSIFDKFSTFLGVCHETCYFYFSDYAITLYRACYYTFDVEMEN